MRPVYHAAKQIERKPSALVLEACLVCQSTCTVCLSQIFRLHQQSLRIDFANRAHRKDRPFALGDKRARERPAAAMVGIPVCIQSTEPGGRQRLVDGCIAVDPRVALGDRAGIAGELFGECNVEQIRTARPASMMEKTNDRIDPELAQALQSLVRPAPVEAAVVANGAFPQNRIAESRDSQPGEQIKVTDA